MAFFQKRTTSQTEVSEAAGEELLNLEHSIQHSFAQLRNEYPKSEPLEISPSALPDPNRRAMRAAAKKQALEFAQAKALAKPKPRKPKAAPPEEPVAQDAVELKKPAAKKPAAKKPVSQKPTPKKPAPKKP
ncbi:hypothetical protein [Candidatus Aquiluna sp. UB-MaderosW2red]|uniref:hypothetical protein n=1 Tax=Candidatus Aquiluna sp. UB-MaderosW2red TaxID=1855377 RepID=UPI000875E57B|nr:hypothetical protein [Candidatus Aquiluna sp. UB-MaderosW2red]SCX14235.1 histone H1/5 [Candidatus Aquiluna sp. UB-MaderosW2red]